MIEVITTCNDAGWKQTGKRMVESFRKQWPASVKLVVYAENFDIAIDGVEMRRLPQWQAEFKERHKDNARANGHQPTRYDFRFDAVKFSHKMGAVVDAGLRKKDGIMIWLDVDTFTHSPVTEEWLHSLFPEPSYIAWLDRVNNWPECGFVMYRCGHRMHQTVMNSLREYYVRDTVFSLREPHDCMVLMHLVESMVRAGEIEPPVSLSGDKSWSHPFVNGPLGAKMDHMKGDRKQRGRSDRWDLKTPRAEHYWKYNNRG